MDSRDSCCKDNKKMDFKKVWQWRMLHVKKYSRRPEPFHCSREIGLDFNVGSKTHKKLDLQSLTNGVILEICDFAKMVNKSKRHFITNILENNFDLGLKNEQHRIEFTSQILHQVRDLILKPPEDKHEGFTLFDVSSKSECANNSKSGFNITSTEHKTNCFLMDMDDLDESEYEHEFECSPAPSKENTKTEDLGGQLADDSEDDFECSGSTEELKENVLPPSFPCCEEIGLNLDVDSKQNLDLHMLTKGVMLELAHFTRVLSASYRSIVLSVLEHNFELDITSQQGKNQVWFEVLDILRRRKQLIADFKSEGFSFQTKLFKREPAPSNVGQMAEDDHHYMCPVDSDDITDSECAESQDDIQSESESSCHDHVSTTTDGSSSLRTVNSNVNPAFESQPDETGLCEAFESQPDKTGQCEDEEKTQTPRIVPNICDMKQEEMETDSNMWKLRTNRGKQILLLEKEYCTFKMTKRFALEFDVGFGSKKNFRVSSLNNTVLLKVADFALAMNSSQEHFIMEILEYNFDFGLKRKTHRKTFVHDVMHRVKLLKNCEDAVKYSKEAFQLPDLVSSVTRVNQSTDSVNPELSSILRKEESDVASMDPSDLHAETKERRVDLYPFCNEIGLQLNVLCSQPNKKIEINKLTNGAMTEVTNFAEKLCGTFEQICLDILKHNCGLHWHAGDSDLARNIVAQMPIIVEQESLLSSVPRSQIECHAIRDFSNTVTVECHNNPNVDTSNADTSQAPITDQSVRSSTVTDHEDELNVQMWKLRANQVQKILSVPHGEHCLFYSYSRCRKIGIDFNVGSGVRQNLDPKLLTNGVMAELYTFANELHSAQKEFITEILEHNFDLEFNSELHRSNFARDLMGKVRVIKQRKNRKRLMNMVFELPDLSCVKESPYWGSKYCPKCYQDRNSKLCQEDSDAGSVLHPFPFTITDPVSAEARSAAQKCAEDLYATFQATERTVMDSYPHCKNVGLRLVVNKDQPKDELDTNVLTFYHMGEMACFARELGGTRYKVVKDIIKHNFNLDIQSQDVNPALQFRAKIPSKIGTSWFNEVFVIQRCLPKHPKASSAPDTDKKEIIKQRQLALWTKKIETSLPTDNMSVTKSEKNEQSSGNCIPICTEGGLVLDVTSKSNQNTPSNVRVCLHRIDEVTRTMQSGLKRKQNKRALSPTIESVTKRLKKEEAEHKETNALSHHADFCAGRLTEDNKCPLDSDDIQSESQSSCHDHVSTTTDGSSSLQTVNSNVNPPFESQPDKTGLCGDEEMAHTPRNVPNVCDMEQEEMENESNMWKLRANRGKQIISLDKELWSYRKSRINGPEFDVGFGPKKNFRVDSFNDSVLFKIAKFALAMNSSQEHFIMEILEYNFDFGLKSKTHRKTFVNEVMRQVKLLKNCEDAVKHSKEAFQLPDPLSSVARLNQSTDSVNPELSSILRKEESDVASMDPSDLHAETQEHRVDLYPFCNEIGLQLNVLCSQPNKKLENNKLTNGAMTEVTNFAEKLCGTFEQICLDILKHNCGLHWHEGDSDLARNFVAQIPIIVDQRNLWACITRYQKMCPHRTLSLTTMTADHQNNPNVDTQTHNADSSQAPITEQGPSVRSSTVTEHEDEPNVLLWKLRANQVQKILSVPHGEHCLFYSYSRCRKIGIDFNVGSGVRQNLDPKLLTNGVMVELYTFANELHSAQKEFITEILEHNFHLDFDSELHRSNFGLHILSKVCLVTFIKMKASALKRIFQLPDLSCIEEPTCWETKYCPKCYQDRNSKLCKEESDAGNVPHSQPFTMTDAVSAEARSAAQKCAEDLCATFQTTEETILNRYPRCKNVGFRLFVNNQPKYELDTSVLTFGLMKEVDRFARELCGRKVKVINDIIGHNFNVDIQSRDVNPAGQFRHVIPYNGIKPTWFSEVFVIKPHPPRGSKDWSKREMVSASEKKELIKERQLALQTKKKKDSLASDNLGVKSAEKNWKRPRAPICTEIGLDLDITSKSPDKEKLDLKLLTRAVMMEIFRTVSHTPGTYRPKHLYDILDYNFDLSSQHHRRWEFCLSIASQVQAMARTWNIWKNPDKANEIFELPFVFECEAAKKVVPKKRSKKRVDSSGKKTKKKAKASVLVQPMRYHSGINGTEPSYDYNDTYYLSDLGRIMQMSGSQVIADCDSLLQENVQIKEEKYDPHFGNMDPEPDTDGNYYPYCEDIKTESDTKDVNYLVQGEPAGSLDYTLVTIGTNSESYIERESEMEDAQYYTFAEPHVYQGNDHFMSQH